MKRYLVLLIIGFLFGCNSSKEKDVVSIESVFCLNEYLAPTEKLDSIFKFELTKGEISNISFKEYYFNHEDSILLTKQFDDNMNLRREKQTKFDCERSTFISRVDYCNDSLITTVNAESLTDYEIINLNNSSNILYSFYDSCREILVFQEYQFGIPKVMDRKLIISSLDMGNYSHLMIEGTRRTQWIEVEKGDSVLVKNELLYTENYYAKGYGLVGIKYESLKDTFSLELIDILEK